MDSFKSHSSTLFTSSKSFGGTLSRNNPTHLIISPHIKSPKHLLRVCAIKWLCTADAWTTCHQITPRTYHLFSRGSIRIPSQPRLQTEIMWLTATSQAGFLCGLCRERLLEKCLQRSSCSEAITKGWWCHKEWQRWREIPLLVQKASVMSYWLHQMQLIQARFASSFGYKLWYLGIESEIKPFGSGVIMCLII